MFCPKYENNFCPVYSENLKTGTFFRIVGEGCIYKRKNNHVNTYILGQFFHFKYSVKTAKTPWQSPFSTGCRSSLTTALVLKSTFEKAGPGLYMDHLILKMQISEHEYNKILYIHCMLSSDIIQDIARWEVLYYPTSQQ